MSADESAGPRRMPPPLIGKRGQALIGQRNVPRAFFRDLYHRYLVMPWRWVFLHLAAAYFTLNTFFALLYLVDPGGVAGAEPGNFRHAFNFSIQTFSTIGYGGMTPVSPWANTLVSLQAMTGLIVQAVVTGLIFAKFARPTARVMFTEKLVVTRHDGERVLQLRLGNERTNQIVEAKINLTLLLDQVTPEGRHFRRLSELPLVRGETPAFVMSWTVMHVVDDTSPFSRLSLEELVDRNATILATFVGVDDTFNQVVHARSAWTVEDVVWDHHFRDIIGFDDDGTRYFDYQYFDTIVPDTTVGSDLLPEDVKARIARHDSPNDATSD